MLVELHQCLLTDQNRLPHDLSVAIQRVDNRAEMVSHPTFQESWGMLVDMNFKVGDQLPRRVPKCLGRSSFGHSFRDFEICLVQLAEDGVDAFLQTREFVCWRRLTECGPLFVQFTPFNNGIKTSQNG